MDNNDNSHWASERLSLIEPSWEPNVARAASMLDARLTSPPRHRAWVAAASLAGLALLFLALPQGRAIAQELWFRLFLNRIDIVRLDLSDLPLQTKVMGSGQHDVGSVEAAQTEAGFRPHLPAATSGTGTPTISVIGEMTMTQTVHTAELRSALARVGDSESVPDVWNGQTVRATIGPMVSARYPGDVVVLQAKPVQLFVPASLPLDQLAEISFRSLGLSWYEARAMARRFVSNPSLLIGIPPDEPARIENVSLRTGSGLLAEEFKEDGTIERVTLVFSSDDRVYSVISPSRETCLKVADLLQ